ncbi:hypothetical protein TorRG33x02_008860 [Trema orientale]|uniref:Uncharacterized protein n=1 Tax=Trema orientale TaxID=63057 RepID=A0A2P5G0Y5_TREOI|nr:hypothetical protein TorRG33x02_008860 [Trema orientale]
MASSPPAASTSTEATCADNVPPSAPQKTMVSLLAPPTTRDKSYLQPFVNRLSHHYPKACLLAFNVVVEHLK